MQWIEIAIICQEDIAETITEIFDDFTPNGIIEEPLEGSNNQVKLTIYGDVSETEEDWVAEVRQIMAHNLDETQLASVEDVYAKTVSADDWLNSWQQFIEPSEILPGIIIKPEWQDYQAKEGDRVIEIASDLSFGTGAHETTKNCAKLAAQYLCEQGIIDDSYILVNPDKARTWTCLDIGTGTGILVLVAHALGLGHLYGIDIEASAVEDAKKNCQNNGVEADIICGDLDKDFHGQADLIFANLTVDPLKILLPMIGKKLAPAGKLIISGIIDERYQEIMPYIEAHWTIDKELVDNGWHTFLLSPKSIG